MFVVTLVAVGAAVAAWLRPLPEPRSTTPPTPTFSAQQVTDAKSKVCAAFAKVKEAAAMNSNRTGGDDPNGQLLIAVNGRQVYIASSQYVLKTLADQPAAPSNLVAEGRKLVDLYQTMVMDGLSSDPNVQAHEAANATGEAIDTLCA